MMRSPTDSVRGVTRQDRPRAPRRTWVGAASAAVLLASALLAGCGDGDAQATQTPTSDEAAADVQALLVEEAGKEKVVSATVSNPTGDTVTYQLTVAVFDQESGAKLQNATVRIENVEPEATKTGESEALEVDSDSPAAILTDVEREVQE